MKKVYSFEVELTAILQAQPVKRKSSVIIGTDNPDSMSVEEINRPENLHRAIPRFLTGKIREAYKCTKVLGFSGPVGLDMRDDKQKGAGV